MFNLAACRYTLRDRSFDVYISGCKGDGGNHCPGCHNPQLWDPEFGRSWESYKQSIVETVDKAGDLVSSIRIYGGEPLEQSEADLKEFFSFIQGFNLPIWLFTRFEFEDVPKWILDCVEYVKCGKYDETQKESVTYYGVTLSTRNQKIYHKGEDF